jgi:hypothetical protein|tara:strand:- start:43 stop:237 length:195 start_codon:yes stop_codon:yes gene_type:complete
MTEEWFEEIQKVLPKLLPQATVDYTGGCVKCKKFVRGGKTECDYNLPGGSRTDYVVGTFCPMKV